MSDSPPQLPVGSATVIPSESETTETLATETLATETHTSAAATAPPPTTSSEKSQPWTICVKTVGKNPNESPNLETQDSTTTTPAAPRDFAVTISPQDPLNTLYDQIKSITGLKYEQQRLIYRGRLIANPNHGNGSSSSSSFDNIVGNVDGLENGQTIHLVPRPAAAVSDSSAGTGTGDATGTDENGVNILDNPDLESNPIGMGMGGAGLLSALLAMGRDDANNENNETGGGGVGGISIITGAGAGMDAGSPSGASVGGSRTRSQRRRRPNSHRRIATDPRFQEPCPLEPLRQGLMTLHTMMGSHSHEHNYDSRDGESTGTIRQPIGRRTRTRMCTYQTHSRTRNAMASPLDTNRWWYKGQWLDVRDTVNQWLEATVVEVLSPDDILTRVSALPDSDDFESIISPAMDAAIGTNDTEGRLNLLLQPAEDTTDRNLADLNDNPDLVGLTERKNNDNVQLLLVHYNGWPHRWDEWIRSDSERIRPFRTRSRHVLTRNQHCPMPESTFSSAPSTFIKSDNDDIDRAEILPEMYRSISEVQELFAGAIRVDDNRYLENFNHAGAHERHDFNKAGVEDAVDNKRPLTFQEQSDLTDALQDLEPDIVEQVLSIVQGKNEGGKDMDPSDIDVAALDRDIQWKLKILLDSCSSSTGLNLAIDRQLPWKQNYRAQRCKDDDSDGIEEGEDTGAGSNEQVKRTPNFDKKTLESLAPLLDRLGRILIDAAPHVATVADSLPVIETEKDEGESINANVNITNDDPEETESQPPQTQSRELRPSWTQPSAPSVFESESEDTSGPFENANSSSTDNPDYVDFVDGFINHRNEGPSTRRGSQGRNRSEGGSIGSSLLSGFLASALRGDSDRGNGRNGPRVVRVGGGTGNGGNPTNGSGIDIHIHAIVTGGNGGDTAPDLGGLAEMIATSAPTIQRSVSRTVNNVAAANVAPATSVTPPSAEDEEDMGLFDDLYSDNPSERNNRQDGTWRPFDDEDRDEVEIEDEEDDEMPALMSRDDSSSSSDSDSSDQEMPMLRARYASDSSDDDDSSDGLPPLVHRQDISDDDSSIDGLPPGISREEIDSVDDDSSDVDISVGGMSRANLEDRNRSNNSSGTGAETDSSLRFNNSIEPSIDAPVIESEESNGNDHSGDGIDKAMDDADENNFDNVINEDNDDELESLPALDSVPGAEVCSNTGDTYTPSNNDRSLSSDVNNSNGSPVNNTNDRPSMLRRLFRRPLSRNARR